MNEKSVINSWKTPDWLKSAFQAIIILIMTMMLNEWKESKSELTCMRLDLSVMTENTKMTKEVLLVELNQIKEQIKKTASKEGLESIERRVNSLERIVMK